MLRTLLIPALAALTLTACIPNPITAPTDGVLPPPPFTDDTMPAAFKDHLPWNPAGPDVKNGPMGLQYIVLKEGPGGGRKPVATDRVSVHYEGRLATGEKFDSSLDRGEPASFRLNQVIPGWTEGVQLMSMGSKYRFYIPQQLAYGPGSPTELIPPFSVLIFEVELLDIEK